MFLVQGNCLFEVLEDMLSRYAWLFLKLTVSLLEGKYTNQYDTSCVSSEGVHNFWLPFCEEIKNM